MVLEADGQGGPVLRYAESMKMRLVSAAISSVEYPWKKGKSINLLLEDLEMMMRLGWRDRKREVELWHGGTGKVNILDRK